MSKPIPVETGQCRKSFNILYIWGPGRRKGWWLTVSSAFPYPVEELGRRELEGYALVDAATYFSVDGDGVHPGASYHQNLAAGIVRSRRSSC